MNIEAMAREAGMRPYQEQAPGIDGTVGDWSALERFAALVRAQSLEEAARVCDDKERRKWEILTGGGQLTGFGPLDCAFAIRAIAAKPTQTPP